LRRAGRSLVLAAALLSGPPALAAAGDDGGTSDDAGAGADAIAAPVPEEAQRRLAEGNRLFREARYDEALAEYRAAFAVYPSGKLHFNIGLTQKMRGDPVAAATELDLFLEAPCDADADVRADAARYLEELSGMVSTVWARSAATGSSVSVDGVPVAGADRRRPIRLSPGRHLVLVREPGAAPAWTRTLDLAAGASVTIAPDPATLAAPAILQSPRLQPPPLTAAPSTRPIYRRWWFWAAAAAVVGAGVLTAMALRPTTCDCYVLTKTPGTNTP